MRPKESARGGEPLELKLVFWSFSGAEGDVVCGGSTRTVSSDNCRSGISAFGLLMLLINDVTRRSNCVIRCGRFTGAATFSGGFE